MKIHPAANMLPMMDDDTFQAFRDDVATNGMQEPIVIWRGQLVDGRNRLKAMKELGIDPAEHTRELDTGADPVEYVVSANLHRRHLSTSQRAMVAASLATLPRGSNQHTQICGTSSQGDVAEKLNVSPRAVQAAKAVQTKCAEPIQALVTSGELSVSAAEKLAKAIPDRDEQTKLAEQGPQAIKEATKDLPEDDEFDDAQVWEEIDYDEPVAPPKKPANIGEKCPNCGRNKWRDGRCVKCGQVEGESAGDVDEIYQREQRSKTIKTAEALMRAIDACKVRGLLSDAAQNELIDSCKQIMRTVEAAKVDGTAPTTVGEDRTRNTRSLAHQYRDKLARAICDYHELNPNRAERDRLVQLVQGIELW